MNISKSYSAGDRETASILFGNNKNITSKNAQKISAVFSCVDIKARALSVIPLKLYKMTENGKEEWKDNPLYDLLRYQPNEHITSAIYKKMISQDLDLRGNHFSQIVKNGLGQIVKLYPLISDDMVVTVKDGKKTFKYKDRTVSNDRILHIFDIPNESGTYGLSKIEYAKQTLELASNTAQHGNELFKNSAMPSGAFLIDKALNDDAFNRLKTDLKEKYTGLTNSGEPMLLEDGLKYEPLRMTNSDSEWLESRKYNREEIGAIFGVPVAMLNDSTNTAYGNLEQKYLEFYSSTIFPLTTIIEESVRQKLLNDEEKKQGKIKFKYNAMLRVDAQTRANYYQTRFNIASISPNEVRGYEDENGYAGGEDYYMELNRQKIQDKEEEPSEN